MGEGVSCFQGFMGWGPIGCERWGVLPVGRLHSEYWRTCLGAGALATHIAW